MNDLQGDMARTQPSTQQGSAETGTAIGQESVRSTGRRWKTLTAFALSLALLAIVLVGVLPEVLRQSAVSRITAAFDREAKIQDLDFNLFTGSFSLTGFLLKSPESHEPLFEIQQVKGALLYAPLFSGEVRLDTLEVIAPTLRLERTSPSTWNVSDLFEGGSQASSASGRDRIVTIQHVQIRNGHVILHDRMASLPQPVPPISVENIDFKAEHFSTAPGKMTSLYLSADSSENSQILLGGQLSSDFKTGTLQVDLKRVPLAFVQPYLESPIDLEGSLHARASVVWPDTTHSQVMIRGDAQAEKFVASYHDQPVGQFERVLATNMVIFWPSSMTIAQLDLVQPEVWIRRESDGTFQLIKALEREQPVTLELNQNHARQEESAPTQEHPLVRQVSIRHGTLHLVDQAISPPHETTLKDVAADINDDLTADSGDRWNITGQANLAAGGSLMLQGNTRWWSQDPVADLRLAVRNFQIPSINPYLEDVLSYSATQGSLKNAISIRRQGTDLNILNTLTLTDPEVEKATGPDIVRKRIGLSLQFLIALLKDVHGNIELTIPIAGQWDSPAFDWSDAIWRSLRNAVVKLVRLPLQTIGKLVRRSGKIDELRIDPVLFESGESSFSARMKNHLSEIATFLNKMPHTRLRIVPIITELDRKQFEKQPRKAWAVSASTPEEAARFVAVRRAYRVVERLIRLEHLPGERLLVQEPRPEQNEVGLARVEFTILPST